MSPPLGKVLMLLLAPLYLIIILTSLTFFLWPLLHSCNFSRKLRRMLAFKRNSEGLNLLISKGVVVECMTLFTKMSLKEYEDNELAPKVNDHYLHVFANVR